MLVRKNLQAQLIAIMCSDAEVVIEHHAKVRGARGSPGSTVARITLGKDVVGISIFSSLSILGRSFFVQLKMSFRQTCISDDQLKTV